MKFEFLPAFQGDCFLIHAGTDAEPCLILVDGGPGGTYEQHLRPRLMEIREGRGLDQFTPLVIDLVIVSHVDDDHISGVVSLFREIRQAKTANDPPLFKVRGLWHNSFDAIIGNDEVKVATAQFGTASLAPIMEETDCPVQFDTGLMLQSLPQGNELRDLATSVEIGIEINEAFGGGLIETADGKKTQCQLGGVTFTVVGPRAKELKALQKKFDEWLEEQKEKGHPITPDSMLQSITDKSVPNLSSIVLIADDGERRALLTGDARGDYILGGLEQIGEIPAGGSLDVDLLKMPHHGSARNVDEAVLSRLKAPRYVFSANGEYSNPDRETLEMLRKVRPDADIEMFLTYSVAEIDSERKVVHENERQKKINKGKPPGPEWSDANDSLKTLISTFPASARVIEPTGETIRPM